jgi:hypothetical protein
MCCVSGYGAEKSPESTGIGYDTLVYFSAAAYSNSYPYVRVPILGALNHISCMYMNNYARIHGPRSNQQTLC